MIDDDDAGLVSNIESHPSSAVQLFWRDEKVSTGLTQSKYYWMLVDEREPVAHRIGIISPVYYDEDMQAERAWIRMEDLEAHKRLIRIE